MGWTAAYVIGTAVTTAVSVDQAGRQRAQARESAAQQEAAAQAQAQANQIAAESAVRREQAAETIRNAEQQASEQLDNTPVVTIAEDETNAQRRRRVQASFGVGAGGAAPSAGSIRL